MRSANHLTKDFSAYDILLVVTQTLAYIIAALPLRAYFKVRRTFLGPLQDLKSGFLLVSNHQSEADPFLILACLPFRSFWKLLPIYFPTTEAVFTSDRYNPRFLPIVTLLGCFSIGKDSTERMKSIFRIRTLLEQGRTVMLFPEGKINKTVNLEDFERGVDFFLPKTRGILFIRITGVSDQVRKQGQSVCTVSFGDPLTPPPPQLTSVDIRDLLEKLTP